ncbi:MAG: hypothetical protein ACI8UO_005128 [Verrucomicrobiales bacterium]|jgi:hypothetical protein
MRFTPFGIWILLIGFATAETTEHDVVIYGGTSAAIAAAVQVKRLGKTVIVVSPDKHLGGLTSGGLGWTDSGKKEAIGGVSREFYQRLKMHYDNPEAWVHQKPEEYSRYRRDDDAMWVFEPRVAEQAYDDWVAELEIPVVRDEWLDREKGVEKDGARISAITMLSGNTYRGRVFMDTTYEGDLLAAAGVSYATGRESITKYGETLNGVQTANAKKHQFDYPVSAYVVPGDASSGLLPRVSADPPGIDGEGDHRLQAYNFRMCLTRVEANRVPFPKPDGYDANQYALIARYLEGGWNQVFQKFDPAPNGKTDTNNHGAFSTDNIGMNYDYPDATYERRREIIAEHRQYQLGLMHFLANDPSVRADVREAMSKWGLAKDEFVDNGNWPHQIYVREARRMVSDFVMTEMHLRAVKPTPDSIGMGSYNMDSHNVQRYVDADGNVRNEGDIQVSPGGPYPISYRAITPKAKECSNLLVPVCVSSSHMAFGSIRMEPVFMVLGHSAADAAVIAINENIDVQAVDYAKLSQQLLAEGQVLEMDRKPHPPKALLEPKSLPGIVFDDTDAKLTGEWKTSAANSPHLGAGYLHDDKQGKGAKSARWDFQIKEARKYEVLIAYPPNANRASNVPITIKHADGTSTAVLNQRESKESGSPFVSIGVFRFAQESAIEIRTDETDGYVIVDGIQLLPKD